MLQFQPISLDVHLVLRRQSQSIIMATLWNTAGHYIFMAALPCRCGHYIFILWFLLSFYLLSFFLACQPLQIGCLPYFHTWCSLSVNLGCRCETCCTQLAENTGCKKSPKIRHLRTIAQLCRAISSQLRHVTTIGKKLLNSNISPTCPYNMVNFSPLVAEIASFVWGIPATFNGFRVLAALEHGTLVVGISQTLQCWTQGATYIWQDITFGTGPNSSCPVLSSIFLSFFFFSLLNLSRHRLDVYQTSTHGVALVQI